MVPRPLSYPLLLSTGPLSPGNDDNMQNRADGLLHVLRICTVLFYSIIQARYLYTYLLLTVTASRCSPTDHVWITDNSP